MNEYIFQYIQPILLYAHIWGFLIIFIFMAIESSFIPFPSEVIMIPAGFLACRGELTTGHPVLDTILAILIGTMGSLTGAIFNYYFALFLGRPFVYKIGKYCFLKPEVLSRAEEIFNNYGDITTFVCRLLPAIRQLISLPAGFSKMPIRKFIFFTFLGAFIWVSILTGIGYYIGSMSKNMSYQEIYISGMNILRHNYIWILLGLICIIFTYIYLHFKIMQKNKTIS